jgi:uncharacterized protein (TIGR00369 family)
MILYEKMNKQRVHTINWEDPKISVRDATSISGIDYLRSIRDGKTKPPPIAMLVGYRIREVGKGSAVFELEPAEYHYNPFATVHGGIASTLLDSAMTAAILSTLSVGLSCATVEFKVNFIRPITSKTGIVQCKAKMIHVGNRIATAEGRIIDNNEQLYAHAVSTLMIFKQSN